MPAPIYIDNTALLALVADGVQQKDIATLFGVCRETIRRRYRKLGITTPGKPRVQVVQARQQVADVVPVAAPHGAHNPFGI